MSGSDEKLKIPEVRSSGRRLSIVLNGNNAYKIFSVSPRCPLGGFHLQLPLYCKWQDKILKLQWV